MLFGLFDRVHLLFNVSRISTNGVDLISVQNNSCKYEHVRPPLWSSGQSFWLEIQRSRVRFPALPDFLSSSGSGTGSTQPREFN